MKKITKRLFLSGFMLTALLFLTGCVKTKKGQPTGEGWVYNLLVKPMSKAVEFFANDLGFGFGLAIILVTVIVRLLILPLGLNQAYKSSYMQEKMRYLKPVLEPIQQRVNKATNNEEKMAAQTELMQAQKENGINMFASMGCLPMLIQMPFFSALFYAARYTNGITEATFLGIDLGKSSLVLTVVAGAFYFLQSFLSTIGIDEEQKKQMKTMMFMSPLMIIMFSFSSPAGVTLYWVVGGLFGVIQQIIVTFMIKPHLRAKIDREFEENPPVVKTTVLKDVTPKNVINTKTEFNNSVSANKNKKNRNAGKQRR
ncbi:membrane protein insertase YidC 2 [Lactococcus hodotermopsidis]|uniref:Membrane protein insertase YidC n=1 Tax=Pseudolactococcus hodotermopsidis TaxID=2709157 RepID=A0A6A0B8H4_9LACT|nr:membrane protein insertase YidC [Lactococcus hodotermopsidis]GFH41622.1 membrane protein insertase YidC 2 [Lactococcus hodotermopsidis]